MTFYKMTYDKITIYEVSVDKMNKLKQLKCKE